MQEKPTIELEPLIGPNSLPKLELPPSPDMMTLAEAVEIIEQTIRADYHDDRRLNVIETVTGAIYAWIGPRRGQVIARTDNMSTVSDALIMLAQRIKESR